MSEKVEKKERGGTATRVISSLLAFPLVVAAFLIQNDYVLAIFLTIITFISMNEYINAISRICNPVKWLAYFSCLAVFAVVFIPAEWVGTVLAIFIPAIMLILFMQVVFTNMKTTFKDVAYTLFGIIYVTFFMIFFPLIAKSNRGYTNIWFLIWGAWGTDVFAYVCGRLFGKHHFTEISPKKTIEGCIGGFVVAIAANIGFAAIVNAIWGFDYNFLSIGIFTAVISILSMLGDLTASSIKRFVDIKDFSNLIPGHGGMLDRIDSLIFLAPFAFLFFTYWI